ncbi:kinase-like domain-containing protein [Rhizophagus irregularis DAOM 181602=DAOM 197198]|nr:kinase-like domain-containing protein [Rhizophagus irregularis DAOM 181602=DAOM 197198]
MKRWDANAEHRPTAEELYKILKELHEEDKKFNNEIRCQMREYDSPSVSENLISECFDVQFYESDLNEINQEEDNLNNES